MTQGISVRPTKIHKGDVHNSTLRKPLLYTANTNTTARNIQIMLLARRHVAVGVAGDLPIDWCHRRDSQLRRGVAHLHQDHLLLKRGERWPVSATSQEQSEENERFHRIDSRPLGREASIAQAVLAVQNGIT